MVTGRVNVVNTKNKFEVFYGGKVERVLTDSAGQGKRLRITKPTLKLDAELIADVGIRIRQKTRDLFIVVKLIRTQAGPKPDLFNHVFSRNSHVDTSKKKRPACRLQGRTSGA